MAEVDKVAVYTVEYATSSRSKCKGPQSCVDKTISANELRFGTSFSNAKGHNTTAWRHWTCVTPKILQKINGTDEMQGYDKLTPEDQERVRTAIEAKSVPEQAAKDAAAKANAPPKEKKRKTKDDEADGEKKPKKPRGKKAKKDEEEEEQDKEEVEE